MEECLKIEVNGLQYILIDDVRKMVDKVGAFLQRVRSGFDEETLLEATILFEGLHASLGTLSS